MMSEAGIPERSGFVQIGRVTRAHGLRGELGVSLYTEQKENILNYVRVFLAAPGSGQGCECTVQRARLAGRGAILQLAGCVSREAAEALIGQELWLAVQDLPQAAEGEWYLHELMGKKAYVAGRFVGTIAALLDTGSQPLLVLRHEGQPDVLIPAVAAFIVQVDAESVTFDLPEGLLNPDAAL